MIDLLENKLEISKNLEGKSCKITYEALENNNNKKSYIKTVSGYATGCCFTSCE